MTAYSVTLEFKHGGEMSTEMFGMDRDEVIAFCKRHYRRTLKRVKSCRRAPKPEVCAAHRCGDQLMCPQCGVTWDVNDTSPCSNYLGG